MWQALCFLLVFSLAFFWLDNSFYKHDSGWEATDNWSGQQFDIVFMGNSHVYCSINPEIINDALHINTINLSSSSQPSEITYYNLKMLLNKTTPKAIVIEANILNTSVDELYEKDLAGLLYRSIDGFRNPFVRALIVGRLIPMDKWLEAFSSLFRPIETWTRFEGSKEKKEAAFLGYIAKEGVLEKPITLDTTERSYKDAEGIQQSAEEKPDLRWIKKILDLAQKKNIPVYIIKTPISIFQAENSNIMLDMNELAKNYPIVTLVRDYNLEISSIGLAREDFYDEWHLNYLGAAKFTEYLTCDLGHWLGIDPDFSKVGWLRGQHYEQLSDDLYRYYVDLYDGCMISFIVTDAKNNIIQRTPFSYDNWIDLPALGNNCKLSFELRSIQSGSYTYEHPQKLRFLLSFSGLESYNENQISVVQDENTLTLTNHFDMVPVQYAWYVYKEEEVIFKQMYTKENRNSFSYEFTQFGNYEIRAFVKTMDGSNTKSVIAVNVTVDKDGVTRQVP